MLVPTTNDENVSAAFFCAYPVSSGGVKVRTPDILSYDSEPEPDAP